MKVKLSSKVGKSVRAPLYERRKVRGRSKPLRTAVEWVQDEGVGGVQDTGFMHWWLVWARWQLYS